MADSKEIKEQVAARIEAENAELKAEEKPGEDIIKFVRGCLNANERGDGALFAYLHRGKYLYNMTLNEWFYWRGHYWDMDMAGAQSRRAVDQVALEYEKAATAEDLTKKIEEAKAKENKDLEKSLKEHQSAHFKRAKRLRSVAGANNCLTWAYCVEDGLSIREDEFDLNPWALACANGVLELKTGRFRPGRPDDLITRAVPHDWKDIEHPAPTWEQFLDEIFGGDISLIGYIQRALGYGITGLVREHKFLVFHGEGRNGKGTLVETLRYVLGDIAKPIQSELLLDQRSARSSSGPSPDIMALKGLRIAFASETDKHRRFSPSKVKWLSGGDSLTARPAHAPFETTFKPTHLLCLLTNNLPHAPGEDFAFWNRMHLVPFRYRFVDDPRGEFERKKISDLPERLEAEAPGILAWLVRGCIEWQRVGLKPPPAVVAATEEYRKSEDLVTGFVEARCEPEASGEDYEKYGELYDAFRAWYAAAIADEKYCPRKKDFSELFEKRFRKVRQGGELRFYGIKLKPDYLIEE